MTTKAPARELPKHVVFIPLAVFQHGEAKWVNTRAFRWLSNAEFDALRRGVLSSWLAL